MISITKAATARLKAIQTEHPEDPIVRISVRDLDESRLSFSITLEATAKPDDMVQHINDMTVALDRSSVPRLEDVTLDYSREGGFRFVHGEQGGPSSPLLSMPSLN
ncbi:MAG TPA: iron-sulfur cluster biosynthesis family protein [Nitrospiraceae bacterium]|jgi:Fe-S cluster assembly iron-binding protein IscA